MKSKSLKEDNTVLKADGEVFIPPRVLVQMFYVLLLVCFSFLQFFPYDHFLNESSQWLWPVSWMRWTNPAISYIVLWAFTLGMLVLTSLGNLRAKWRWGVFVGLFFAIAANYTRWNVEHNWLNWIYVAFLFCFLKSKEGRYTNFLYLLSLSQILILLTYSFSGIWKLWNTLFHGLRDNQFQQLGDVLAYNLSNYVLRGASQNWFLSMVSTLPSALTSLLWISIVALEFSAVLCIWFPRWITKFGVLLILFHACIYIGMRISFLNEALLLALILVIGGECVKSAKRLWVFRDGIEHR